MTILNPQLTVRVAGADVTVRDLPWPVMKEFLARLSAHIQTLIGSALAAQAGRQDAALSAEAASAQAGAVGASVLQQLPAVIAQTTDLAEYLVLATIRSGVAASRESAALSDQWLQTLTSTEFMALLDASLAVTFNEEFVKLGKSVAGRAQAAFNLGGPTGQVPTAPSAKPSISSSGRDGHTRTPVDSPLPSSNSSAT
jgi:hypothetical protein